MRDRFSCTGREDSTKDFNVHTYSILGCDSIEIKYSRMKSSKNQVSGIHRLEEVTPVSKALAAIIFITIPFLGGWVGYQYAPEKIVEMEKIVIRKDLSTDGTATNQTKIQEVTSDSEDYSDIGVSVASVDQEGTRFLMEVSDCYNCDQGWKYNAYSYVYHKEYDRVLPLGNIVAFEWTMNGFKYKPLPEDESLFTCPTNTQGVVLAQLCTPNLEQIEWIEVTD